MISRELARWGLVLLLTTAACGGGSGNEPGSRGGAGPAADDRGPKLLDSFDRELQLDREWVGDLDAMVERGVVRVLVVYSLGQYFLDGPDQRGIIYESLREFETYLNDQLDRGTVKVEVLIIPVRRDELIPGLERGLGDIAAANLTITDARLERVDFSIPTMTDVSELVVSGPSAGAIRSLDDLGGREVYVRRSSSYWESLQKLNDDFRSRGLKPVEITPADEFLQDEDLLDMVNAGLLPVTIVDSHKAGFWAEVFDRIEVHEDLAVRTGGRIGWAFRKGSPQLAEMVNAFHRKHRIGTLTANVILNRYFKQTAWALSALAGDDRARFESTVDMFREYGEQYGFDPLMLAALAYQESRLDQSKRSRAGAVGIMQIRPSTAADPNVGIPDVSSVENNIQAGTKYLRFLNDRYFSDPAIDPVNQALFTIAAYNAGPARVQQLRNEASGFNLDPDVWFGNVEHVAARRVGRETVQYVSNITKYYVAYRLASRQHDLRREAAGASP